MVDWFLSFERWVLASNSYAGLREIQTSRISQNIKISWKIFDCIYYLHIHIVPFAQLLHMKVPHISYIAQKGMCNVKCKRRSSLPRPVLVPAQTVRVLFDPFSVPHMDTCTFIISSKAKSNSIFTALIFYHRSCYIK